MSARKWLSTDISHDARFVELCERGDSFAGLVYLLAVVHSDNNGQVRGWPEELLWTLTPGMMAKTAVDIEEAMGHIVDVGLGSRSPNGQWLQLEIIDRRPKRKKAPPAADTERDVA